MEVLSFGNGDFLVAIFSAVKGVMGDGSFSTLLRISILLGLLMVLYQLFFTMNISTISLGFLKHYIFIIVLFYTLFVPKTDVVIRDEIKNTQVSITQVPYGVGLFAHMFTTAEAGITKLMETYFTTPDDMKFSHTGYAFSVMLTDTLKAATPTSVYFKRSLDDFIVNCFFMDVLWGDKNLDTLIYENNLWGQMNPQHSSSNVTKIYSQTNPSGSVVSCTSAYLTLTADFGNATTQALDVLNKTLQTNVATSLPVVMQTLLNVSMSTTQILQQAIGVNAIADGMEQVALYSGVSADAIAYASALAEQQQRSSWVVAGELAKKYIPILRQVLEAVVYGMFPILFVMMMLPFGMKALHMYFILLMWLLLWSPLYAILNLIVNTRAIGVLSPSYGYYSLGTMPFIYESTNDLTAMAGYLALLVPTISFAIAKGSDYALMSMIGSVTGNVTGMASSTGSQISTPEGGQKAAATMAHMNAAATFGGESWAMAQAAKTYYDIAHGSALGGIGIGGVFRLADSETKNRVVRSEEGAGKYIAFGGDKELMQAVGEVKGGVEIGDANALNNITTNYGFSSVKDAIQAMKEFTYRQTLSQANAVKDFANRYGISQESALWFIANTQIAGNDAIQRAFGGDVGAYRNFLANNMELSLGQQLGVIKAAESAGISLKDYAQLNSFMEGLKRVGAMDAFRNGRITEGDLRNIGMVIQMAEAGYADAAQLLQKITGMDPRQAARFLRTAEGLNEIAKFEGRIGMAKALTGSGGWDALYEYLKQSQGIDELVLNNEMADKLNKLMHSAGYGNFKAKAGDKVTIGYDPSTEKISMAHSTGGGKSENYNLNTVRTGNDVQQLDINKKVRDHMNVDKGGGTEVTMVTPDGVKTGYLAYDPELKRPVLVAGQERYGIDKYMVVDQPEKRDADGKIVQPAGKVVQSVTVDPKTGEVVQGKNMSLLVTEGEIQFGGQTFKGTLYQDTRTGNKLLIDGQSGNFWTMTQTGNAWTMHRGFEGRGEYFSSVVTQLFGKEAGAIVSNTVKGLGEVGGVIGSAKAIQSLGSGSSRSFNPKTFSGKPMSSGEERNSIIKPASKYTNIKNIQKQ